MPDSNQVTEPTKINHQIRSFVRREGRATPGQKAAMETLLPIYGIEPENNTLFNFKAMFGRKAPVVLEIGFGDGEALVYAAKVMPERNFLGAEVYSPGLGHCLLRAEQEQLDNLRVCNQDAMVLLNEYIADNSLDEIRLFFPDPWPKKKHHKRRIVRPDFINLICHKLVLGGRIHFASDWAPYVQWALDAFEASAGLENISGKGQYTPRPDSRIITKFERRGHRLGHGSWDLIFKTTS